MEMVNSARVETEPLNATGSLALYFTQFLFCFVLFYFGLLDPSAFSLMPQKDVVGGQIGF